LIETDDAAPEGAGRVQAMGECVAYVRVSSRAQNYATQRDAIERASSARGDTMVAWYEEKRSAKTMARPELQRLRADAAAGKLSKLYVFRLDRLSRTGVRDTLEALESFRSAGVEVISVSDGFDLNGPAAEIVIAVLAWAAKVELLAKNERIAAARERIESEGGAWGRPPKITPAQRETAQRMRGEGASVRKIAQALGVSKSVIGRTVEPAATAT
jgi:DNA invertase Pin-like site-specific DNA recombinase